MIRVAIADDHAVIRKGLELFIKGDDALQLVVEATNGEELMNLLKNTQVDVLLLDIDMPKSNGLAVLRDLESLHPRVKTIILSMHPEDIYGVNARRMGAKGYLGKDVDPLQVLQAVKDVAGGNTVFREELYKFNRHGFVPQIKMSKRETQVMKMLVAGYANKKIAEELSISDKTVSTYKLRLMRKLKAKSVVDLVRYSEMQVH
jgi:DNA-binding NarL/FixJ family response regulator